MVEEDDAAGARKLLDQFYALGVVFARNLFVVLERRVLGGMVEELETVLVEGGSLGTSAEVLHLDGVGLVFPVGGALARGRIGVDARPCL